MALIEEFVDRGDWLFRKRSYVPLLMFFISFLVFWADPNGILFSGNNVWTFCSIALSLLGLLARLLVIGYVPHSTSGRNTGDQRAEVLNTKGMYSMVRHPLYLGNFLMWLGVLMFSRHPWLILSGSIFYWSYYLLIMFTEENFLRGKFGELYLKWSEGRPAVFPNKIRWQSPELDFSIKNCIKREFYGVTAFVIGFAYVNFLHNIFQNNLYILDLNWQYASLGAIVFFIVIRFLKKQTKLFDISGR